MTELPVMFSHQFYGRDWHAIRKSLDYTGLNREMPNGRHQYLTGYIQMPK